jgi:hypothetical protein
LNGNFEAEGYEEREIRGEYVAYIGRRRMIRICS